MRIFILSVFVLFGVTACDLPEPSASQKQEAARDNVMERANAKVPVPQTDNFVTREMIAEYMRRMDEPNKTFFVYVVANTGAVMGYYTTNGAPVSICAFLAPPDKVEERYGGSDLVRKAPGVDGVYYSGGGCDTYYFFDANSDAMVQVKGLNLFVSDQPLSIEAEPITIK